MYQPSVLTLLIAIVLGQLSCSSNQMVQSLPVDGKLDLSSWDLERDGSVRLGGQWHFWWDQLLPPDAFMGDTLPPGSTLIDVPSSWVNYRDENGVERERAHTGIATYALELDLPDELDESLAISNLKLRGSFNAWLINWILF